MHNDNAVYIVTYSNTGSGMDNVNKVCKIGDLLKVFPLFGKHRFIRISEDAFVVHVPTS